jgi:hypothetical protein
MKLRFAEKKQHEQAMEQAEAIADGENVDWQAVLKEWNEYYSVEDPSKVSSEGE